MLSAMTTVLASYVRQHDLGLVDKDFGYGSRRTTFTRRMQLSEKGIASLVASVMVTSTKHVYVDRELSGLIVFQIAASANEKRYLFGSKQFSFAAGIGDNEENLEAGADASVVLGVMISTVQSRLFVLVQASHLLPFTQSVP